MGKRGPAPSCNPEFCIIAFTQPDVKVLQIDGSAEEVP
jgi:hypothetical protein